MEAQLSPTPTSLPTISRVVVGFDGSPSSCAALHLAARLGPALGAEVEALRTWHYPATTIVPGAPARLEGRADTDEEVTTDLRSAVAAELRGDADAVHCTVERGPAAHALVRHCHERDVLAVLGVRDLSRTDRALLGSTTSEVLHGAESPVLIVPEGAPVGATVRRIVVGVDGTPGSHEAVQLAGMLALQTGAAVTAVHADEPAGRDGIRDRVEHEAWVQERLDTTWTGDLRARNVEVRGVVTEAEPKAALVAIADDEDADLIVVGRSRRSFGPPLHLGSVTSFLVRHTRRPLLVASPAI